MSPFFNKSRASREIDEDIDSDVGIHFLPRWKASAEERICFCVAKLLAADSLPWTL